MNKIEISGDGTALGTRVELVVGDARHTLPTTRLELRRDGDEVHAEIVLRLAERDPMVRLDLSKYNGPDVVDVGTENRTWNRCSTIIRA